MLVEQELLPTQVDIHQVVVEIPDSTGKIRNINLLPALDESTIMLLEDEILAGLSARWPFNLESENDG